VVIASRRGTTRNPPCRGANQTHLVSATPPTPVVRLLQRAGYMAGAEPKIANLKRVADSVAIVLVGQAARDYRRVDAALSANAIVILLPSLQTAPGLVPPEMSRAASPSTAIAGNLLIDLTGRRVLLGKNELRLSVRELAILAVLSEEPRRARTFAELGEPEGGTWVGDNERVRSSIKRLRKKLDAAGADVRIESIRGYGFRLVGPSNGREPTR